MDQGGGGTVAKYVSHFNVDTVDMGVAVLSMHAPFEVISKADLYMTYKAMEANHMWIHPASVQVKVLPPVPTQGMSREEAKCIGERVRSLILEARGR